MSLILCIESATTVCSVAIFRGDVLLSCRELDEGYTHAENLHLFVQDCLKEANCLPASLQAIAVSQGPGSYTGLRIGMSTAKGLAYALNIPLLAIDTLKVIAAGALGSHPDCACCCAMIDARRMEVYTCTYDQEMMARTELQALVVDEQSVRTLDPGRSCVFAGDGVRKCSDLLSSIQGAVLEPGILPSARYMGKLAQKLLENRQFADVAYAEPFYMKEFVAGKKKQEK